MQRGKTANGRKSAKGGQAEKVISTGGRGGDGLGSADLETTPAGGALVVVGPELAGRRAPCTGCVTVVPAASMIRHCPRGAELGSSCWGCAGTEGAGAVEELAEVSVVRWPG